MRKNQVRGLHNDPRTQYSLFAQRETAEASHDNVFTSVGDNLTHQIADRKGLVFHKRLHHQHLRPKDLFEVTMDEVFTPIVGDTSNGRVLQDFLALFFSNLGRHVFKVDVRRRNTSDLQCQVASQGLEALTARDKVGATVQLQQDTHAVIVVNIRENAPLLGLTTSSDHLLGLVVTTGLKDFGSVSPILCFGQGIFTIGTCCIGLFTQLLHVCGSILHGLCLLSAHYV